MERVNIKCIAHHDIRGFHLLGEDGMPFVTIEALRRNMHEDPPNIDVYIDLDRDDNQRNPSQDELQRMKPYVESAIGDVRKHVGDLPTRVFRKCANGQSVELRDWIV